MNEEFGRKLVLMAGLAGVGKSTLAYALSRELKWHVIDKDCQKEVLLREGFEDEKAGQVAYELAFEAIHNVLLKEETSVIFDNATLYRSILENVQYIERNIPNVQLKVIFCIADRITRTERLRKRSLQRNEFNRRHNELLRERPLQNIKFDPETIAEYLQLFTHLPSDKLTLDTTDPLESYLPIAKSYILNQVCNQTFSNDEARKLAEVW